MPGMISSDGPVEPGDESQANDRASTLECPAVGCLVSALSDVASVCSLRSEAHHPGIAIDAHPVVQLARLSVLM